MENEEIIHRGIFYEGDIYEQILKETGIDIRNNPDYRIGYTGAQDNDGISETLYTEYFVFKKNVKAMPVPPVPPIPLVPSTPRVEIKKQKEELNTNEVYRKQESEKFISRRNMGESFGQQKDKEHLIGREKQPVKPTITIETDKDIGLIPPIKPIITTYSEQEKEKTPNSPITPTGTKKQEGEGIEPVPPVPPKDIIEAVKEYVENSQEKKEEIFVRVVRKFKNSATKWLCATAATLVLLSGFRFQDKITTNIETITTTSIGYEVVMENGDRLSVSNEQIQQILGQMGIGDYVNLQKGDELFVDSLLHAPKAVIGNGIRNPGSYQISGISIVEGNRIKDFEVDLNVENPGLTIEDFVKETCEKYGLDASKINVRLHIGNSKNHTRTGWIDATELLTVDHVDQALVDKIVQENSTYNGFVNDFTGSTITINTVNGDVTLNVKDQNGNFYAPGTKVIGSDGNEYTIQDLSVTNQTSEHVNEVVDGKKLTWRIEDCSLAVGLPPLLMAIAAEKMTREKNEAEEKNPKYIEFENEEEYIKFKEEFKKRKEEYEKSSGFRKLTDSLLGRKKVDVLQHLTQEQVKELYFNIKNCHTADYSYSKDDKFEFKNGKIIVIFKDGSRLDITNIVMPSIAHIGKDNPVVTEGLLEEETKGGKTR